VGLISDKNDILLGAQVSQSVPGKDALHGHRHVFSVRGDGLEKEVRATRHVSVQEDFALLVQDTEIHGPRVQIDSAVVSVLLSIEFH